MRGKKREHYINDEIRSREVRIIGQDESYIVGTKEATQKAKEEGKDLILIKDKPNPPIAMIEDYNKFLYDKEKKEKENEEGGGEDTSKEKKNEDETPVDPLAEHQESLDALPKV